MKINLNLFLQKEGMERVFNSSKLLSDHSSLSSDPRTRTIIRTIMRIQVIVILLVATLSQANAVTYGQQITLKRQNIAIENVLKEIEKQSGYMFFYKKDDLRAIENVSVDVKNASLDHTLRVLLKDVNVTFEVFDNTVVIKKGNTAQSNTNVHVFNLKPTEVIITSQQLIRGRVLDDNGAPIQGASIRIKSEPSRMVASNASGEFTLPLTALNEILVISYVGYDIAEIKASLNPNQMVVRLQRTETAVDEVIVTGMMERKKESFTGATASFTGEELKLISNQNLIQSLRALDPSFIQIENNAMGSNPNVLPTIELRGQTSISTENLRDEFMSDPNQPLFILDGFETNLRTIVDLDMNIIESVTILKDAASTAIYGSRASNGVIVIETIKPKQGKVNLTYTTDLNTQISDLRSYNMMNGREKLEFERLSGRYIARNNLSDVQLILDSLYNRRLQEVERGVNTYWLSQPLQNGFSQRHSISARGGEGALLFDASANYKSTKGVMIGNKREDFGANLQVNYRTGKVNIINRAYINGYSSDESPYGSFSGWVNTNPYLRLLDNSEKYLDQGPGTTANTTMRIANPLYNASLNSYDQKNNFTISNNLQINVDFTKSLRLRIGAQIGKSSGENAEFLSPLHTDFDGVINSKKGLYKSRHINQYTYTANAMLTYAKVFATKHILTTNFRTEISENNNSFEEFVTEGFPSAATGNPSFSYGYPEGSRPQSQVRVNRRNSFVLAGNYSYDNRYNVDINANLDGSTAFGANNLYSPYYSFGLSWNLQNESFIRELGWINMLRLRGNYGVTGNQNFGNVNQSVYNYNPLINRFGQGAMLSALGAPNLEWQRTGQTSIGLDAAVLNNRINFQINAYENNTDPLVVAVTLPSSTGLSNYPFNAGALKVRGLEGIFNVSPIYRPQDRVVLTFGLTGTMLSQTYSKFDNKLNSLNNELRESNSLTRYRDGYSPRDIWAVRSLGIDPATGREIFLSQADGQQTFYYSSDDQVVVGNEQPLAEGVLRSTFSYKGFTANIMVRYIWGRDNLNRALYNKVENISLSNVENNQDKRALYDRWQRAGDISQFKSISLTNTTPISSRFVQRENTFSGESISFGYEFRDRSWLDAARIGNLRMNAYMNDIFYSSTVRRERGIDFPFARSVSMSLVATFK